MAHNCNKNKEGFLGIIRFLVLSMAFMAAVAAHAEGITCGAYAQAAESIAANRGKIPGALIPGPGHSGPYIAGMGRKQYNELSALYRDFIQRSPFMSDWFAPLVAAMCIRKGDMGHAFDDIGMVIQECNVSSKNKLAFADRMRCLLDSDIVTSGEVANLVAEKSSSLIPSPKR